MKNYQLLISSFHTLLLTSNTEVKDNETCWIYNLKSHMLMKITCKEILIANDRKVIGSIDKAHGVFMLNQQNIAEFIKSQQKPILYDVEIDLEEIRGWNNGNVVHTGLFQPKLNTHGEILITKIL